MLKVAAPGTTTRWVIYGVVLALALVAVRMVDEPDRRAAPPPSVQIPRAADAKASTPTPELALDGLGRRGQRAPAADPFNALAADEPRREASPPPPPPAPQAPPLPFTYLGKVIEGERIAVFLSQGDRNWVVRAGDTIEGAWRVEAIGDRTMTLSYLPLQTRQELEIGTAPGVEQAPGSSTSEALPVTSSGRSGVSTPGEVPLLLAAPSRVPLGGELVVSVGLPPGRAVRDARAELTYDPKVFAAVDGPPGSSGRVNVALAGTTGSPAQVRLKVIAQAPTTTQLGIENATASDARGASVPIAMPGAHAVAIVQGSRRN